jgi:hypothetical protein
MSENATLNNNRPNLPRKKIIAVKSLGSVSCSLPTISGATANPRFYPRCESRSCNAPMWTGKKN